MFVVYGFIAYRGPLKHWGMATAFSRTTRREGIPYGPVSHTWPSLRSATLRWRAQTVQTWEKRARRMWTDQSMTYPETFVQLFVHESNCYCSTNRPHIPNLPQHFWGEDKSCHPGALARWGDCQLVRERDCLGIFLEACPTWGSIRNIITRLSPWYVTIDHILGLLWLMSSATTLNLLSDIGMY